MTNRIITLLALFGIMTCIIFLVRMPESYGGDFKLLELKDATMEYKSFMPGGYRPTLNGNGLENSQPGKEVILHLNTDVLRYAFFNNRVHGGTEELVNESGKGTGKGQFRDVGWEFNFGVRPSSYFTLQYTHHSQHMLDHKATGRFPVEDSVGLQLHLYRDRNPSDTIF